MKINSHNTAISRTGPSRPLKVFLKSGYLSHSIPSILDYGCGRGDDAAYLRRSGYTVVAWDPHWKSDPKPETGDKFNAVMCTYVICVEPEGTERLNIVKDAWQYVAPEGFLVLSARSETDIKFSRTNSWQPYKDGWITSLSRKTFQKGFSPKELAELTEQLKHGDQLACEAINGYVYSIVQRKA